MTVGGGGGCIKIGKPRYVDAIGNLFSQSLSIVVIAGGERRRLTTLKILLSVGGSFWLRLSF